MSSTASARVSSLPSASNALLSNLCRSPAPSMCMSCLPLFSDVLSRKCSQGQLSCSADSLCVGDALHRERVQRLSRCTDAGIVLCMWQAGIDIGDSLMDILNMAFQHRHRNLYIGASLRMQGPLIMWDAFCGAGNCSKGAQLLTEAVRRAAQALGNSTAAKCGFDVRPVLSMLQMIPISLSGCPNVWEVMHACIDPLCTAPISS